MMKKPLLSFLFLIPIFIISLAIYAMSTDDIEGIVICSTNEKASYLPSKICEYYLFNYRLTAEDVKYIENRAGLNFLFGISDHNKKYKFIGYFLSKGVSINKPSTIDGLPPLHAAILDNDEELVQYLLENGADTHKKDARFMLTSEEFAEFLEQKNHAIDMSTIKKIISSSEK